MEIIFNSVPVGLYRSTVDGRLLQANPMMAELLGYGSVGELLEADVRDFWVDPLEREGLIALLDRDGATAQKEAVLRRRDGSTLWVDLFARRIDGPEPCLAGMIHDITARKQLEERADRSEALFRRVFDQLPIGAALLSPDGRFHRANEAYCRMLGYSEEELKTKTFLDLTHPEERRKSEAVTNALVTGETEHIDLEKRYLHKNGSVVWGAVSVRLIKDALGRVLWHMPVIIDVTERRGLEHQLRQAQKMEAVGQLAGGIAHDFNNILTAVLGYCDLALDRAGDNEGLIADLRQIQEGGHRAAALTRQLLAFSRTQVLRLEVADLNQVLERFLDLVRPMIGEDIELTLDPAPVPPLLKADIAQLQQVAMNLVVNARDAMPGGGAIRMRTAAVSMDGGPAPLDDAAVPPGEYVQLVIEDTGTGMSEETRRRLFEPFFTTKAPGKGTGLGLAVVYGIVKQMGGFIAVTSEIGRGATFTLTFPRAEQPHDAAERVSADTHAAGTCQETILLVEDDDDVRIFAAMVLRHAGYQVTEAAGGSEALELLRQGPRPDLVLTDMVMPAMSGAELAQRLAAIDPSLQVLVTSGYLDHRLVSSDGLDRDVNLIEKPFSARTLLSRVRKALDARHPDSRSPA